MAHQDEKAAAPDLSTPNLCNGCEATGATSEALSESDRALIWKWNAKVPLAENVCIHKLFERIVQANPDAPAIHAWDGRLTYQDLDQRSSCVAQHLVEAGVGPGAILPLLFEKSMFTVVALLGVVKAGASFVLLDTKLPEARLKVIASQITASMILTSPLYAGLADRLASKVLVVDRMVSLLPTASNLGQHRDDQTSPSSTLYVVFTSGSTGTPKGVVISHANFASAVKYQATRLRMDSETRMFEFTRYGFDVAIATILMTLLTGGCLCVPSEIDLAERMEETMIAMAVTAFNITPTIAQILSPSRLHRFSPALKSVMMSGEAMNSSILAKWTEFFQVSDIYGPSECTPFSTAEISRKGEESQQKTIGKGIGSVTWVVQPDDPGQLVPIGAIGELVLEGPIVGQGYLNDPTTTDAAFICNPTWLLTGCNERPGRSSRLYKTGDLVRYHTDGSLIYLGRKDTQKKIRGQRIELGEVEGCAQRALGDIEVVADICTMGDAPETDQLIAFVKSPSSLYGEDAKMNGDQTSNTAATIILPPNDWTRAASKTIKGALFQILPSYMVPSFVLPVAQIPRQISSNKTDRKLLRDTVSGLSLQQLLTYETVESVACRAPATDEERTLQDLYANALNIQTDIGADDHFFQLGGNSILAMKLINVARSRGVVLTMMDILSYPKICDLARKMGKVSPESELEDDVAPLSLLMGQPIDLAIAEAARCCDVADSQIEDIYPCTPLQEGLLALSVKKSGSEIDCQIFQLDNGVDLPRLRAAWVATARVNSIMRTRIVHLSDIGSMQIVVRDDFVPGTADNLEQCLSSERSRDIRPSSRLTHVTFVDEGCLGHKYVVWTAHHAATDGWQSPLVFDQIERAYRGELLPRSVDFSVFARYVMKIDQDEAAAYWQRQLVLPLPATFPALPSTAYAPWTNETRHHVVHLGCNRPVSEYTLSTAIRLAWALLIGSYVESDDVVFGVTVTGRNAPIAGIEKMIGPTIATVPLRVKLDRKASIQAALQTMHHQAATMVPFEQTGLQNIRRLVPAAKQACDFQTLLVIQPPPALPIVDAVQTAQEDDPDAGLAFGSFGLVMECTILQNQSDIKIAAHVDTNVIDPAQVEKILEQLGHVLGQICKRPNSQLGSIDKVSPEDVRRLHQWNKPLPEPGNWTINQLFRLRRILQPAAPAVCSSTEGLTYEALDELSSRLARHLHSLGIGRETIVPLCCEKSILSPIMILGILKCGAACVSLDSNWPMSRLEHIIGTTGASTVLVTRNQRDHFRKDNVRYVVVTRPWLDQLSEAQYFDCDSSSDSAAFVVFTSGSTGTPKGIVLEHKALVSSTLAHGPFLGVDTQARVLQLASPAFDIYIYEHLTTLALGGCICIPSEEERTHELSTFARKTEVSAAIVCPTTLRTFFQWPIPSLKHISLGGEPMAPDLIDTWLPSTRITNGYGPAECTICCANAIDPSRHPLATIGRPLGAVFWIVEKDDHTKLAPIGVAGELFIEGSILARGYLNDPAQTAAAFVEAPAWWSQFRQSGRGKLYRTGDLVKYNPDGTIVFLGRKDTQVKLRGYRIELGEVEHRLQRHLGEAKVAAEVVSTADKETYLVAFVSLVDTKHSTDFGGDDIILSTDCRLQEAETILLDLAKSLPAYMVPTVLLPVHHMPTTASGKTDRKLLREAAAVLSREQLMAYHKPLTTRSPTTTEELLMRNLWAELLRISPETIGADANFFRLGGDSILAMKLMDTARSKHRSLTVANIFKFPTLSELVEYWTPIDQSNEVHRKQWTPFSLLEVEDLSGFLRDTIADPFQIPVDSIVDVLPATGHQSFELENNCPYFTFHLSKEVDLDRVLQSWKQVIAKHDILRTVFVPYHDGHLQVVLKEVSLEITTHGTEDVLANRYIVEEAAAGALPLGKSSLKIIVVRSRKQIDLVVRMSHAQYDGWSIGELWKDWGAVFNGKSIPDRTPFPSFIYATARIREAGGFQYWRNLLRGSQLTYFKEVVAQKTPIPAVRKVRTFRTISGVTKPDDFTMATVVKAAWVMLLAKRLSTTDVIIVQLTSGRRRGQDLVDDAVGPCLQLIPIRTDLQPHWTGRDLCQFVQSQDVDSMTFENIELWDIIQECTDWPQGKAFSTVHHQSDVWHVPLTLGDLEYLSTNFLNPYIPTEVELSTLLRGDELDVEICSASNVLDEARSADLNDEFCASLRRLVDHPSANINPPALIPNLLVSGPYYVEEKPQLYRTVREIFPTCAPGETRPPTVPQITGY